jgi:hypothetical protein
MRGYQSLQKDSQSLQNPAEMRFYWISVVLKNATEITEFLEKIKNSASPVANRFICPQNWSTIPE